MRRSRPSRPPVFLLLAPLAWVACFSASSAGPGTNVTFDSGLDFDGTMPDGESPEGSPPVEAAADAVVEAAPPVDAGADVPMEAAPMPIGVVVADAAGPESGVTVFFSDKTGAVVGNPTQTVKGVAATLDPTVAMVTVVLGTPASPFLYTVMGLSPGDQVLVADAMTVPNPTMNLTSIPTTPALPTEAQYSVISGNCGTYFQAATPTSPATYPLFGGEGSPPCVGFAASGGSLVPKVPALVQAFDELQNVLGFAYADVDLTTTTPDDAGLTDYAVGGSWSTATAAQTVYLNVPDGGVTTATTYSEILDGIVNPLPHMPPAVDAGAGAQMLVQAPTGIGQGVQAETFAQLGSFAETYAVAMTMAPPTANGNVTLDLTGEVNAPMFTNGGVSASAQPVVSWTLASGDLSKATGIIATWGWNTMPTADAGDQNGTWTVVAPGTSATSLAAPALPAALQAYGPTAASLPNLNEIIVVSGPPSATYGSLVVPIASVFPIQPCLVAAPVFPALPVLGATSVVLYTPGGAC